MKKFIYTSLLFIFLISQTACWATPDSGTVQVQTIWSKPTMVVRPPGIWTILLGRDVQ